MCWAKSPRQLEGIGTRCGFDRVLDEEISIELQTEGRRKNRAGQVLYVWRDKAGFIIAYEESDKQTRGQVTSPLLEIFPEYSVWRGLVMAGMRRQRCGEEFKA